MMFLPEMNRGVSVKKKKKRQKWFKGETVCVDGRSEGKNEGEGRENGREEECWREWATLFGNGGL